MKKKILWSLVIVISLFLCGKGISYAAVSGACVNCHTMHNSQGGAVMATGTDVGDAGYGSLTRGTCGGCHETTETDPLYGGYPRVKAGSNSDTNQLAGGYFSATSGESDEHDNTEHSIGSTVEPAGYDSASNYVGEDWYKEANGLKCAGNSGCHGNETDTDPAKAIAGGHHANTLKGLNTGYRMLQTGSDNAVLGTGASDYEKALNAAPSGEDARNYYSATTNASISKFCGKCHGNFHGDVSDTTNIYVDSAWARHPTDQIIPTTWAIQTLDPNYDHLDWKFNPVGTINAAAPADNNMYVTCLSCHRAHGSANADILRFAYADQCADGGGTNGCLGCHDRQR